MLDAEMHKVPGMAERAPSVAMRPPHGWPTRFGPAPQNGPIVRIARDRRALHHEHSLAAVASLPYAVGSARQVILRSAGLSAIPGSAPDPIGPRMIG